MKYISQSVSELSVKPAKAVTSWLTDQIAPTYWKPNSLILVKLEQTHLFCCENTERKHGPARPLLSPSIFTELNLLHKVVRGLVSGGIYCSVVADLQLIAVMQRVKERCYCEDSETQQCEKRTDG